jgi:hypothetical protein
MERAGNSTRKSENGYVSHTTIYEAKNCIECPLKCLCYNANGNRRIEVNHKLSQYRANARQLLKSHEGQFHRRQRSIKLESVFGQTKANKQYNRFRHFGLDKVKMDFAIFVIAFNVGKLYNKSKNTSKKRKNRLFIRKINTFCFLSCSLAEKIVRLMIFAEWTGKSQRNEKIRSCTFETAPYFFL